jgi:hypothetical protein
MMNWHTVKSSDLVWAPIGTYVNKNGEVRTKFKRIGVRVTMMDNTWWFFSFKHESWTKHNKPVQRLDRLGRPMIEGGKPVFLPERKERYTIRELHKEWGTRKPELVVALETAVTENTASEE